jgi:hypothetical protein
LKADQSPLSLSAVSWHNGSAPVPTFTPDPNDPHSVVVTAASLGYWTVQAAPDPSAGSGASDVPYGWDFTGMGLDALATMHYVSEALQYLAHSPTALQLLRDARAHHVTIVIQTERESFTVGSVVHWNTHAGGFGSMAICYLQRWSWLMNWLTHWTPRC